MRHLTAIVSLCLVFTGCARSRTESLVSPSAVQVSTDDSGVVTTKDAPAHISVDQSTLYLSCFVPSSGLVTTSTNGNTVVTATVDSGTCEVAPNSQEGGLTRGSGTKKAVFVITAHDTNGCKVSFTDKKGASATVTVAFADGSCWL